MKMLKDGEVAVTYRRLKQLERREAKIDALEAGGVDNWEGYDDALEGYRKEIEQEERLEQMMNDVLSELGSGAYEPTERGAGFAFSDDAIAHAMTVFRLYGVQCTKEGTST